LVLFASLDLNQPSLPDRWHWIGAITYSVYLLHMPVLIGLRLVTGDKLPLESPMMLIIFIIVVIGFAVPTHRYFERPAQKLVLRLSEKRIGSSPSA
jgi:peptidoglycan/LPS O-acetylase OafA/YrhL